MMSISMATPTFTVDLRKLPKLLPNWNAAGHGLLDVCEQAQAKYGQVGTAVGLNKIQHLNVE